MRTGARSMPCRIRHGTFVNAGEMVRRLRLAGMPMADFFNILLGPVHSLLDHTPKFD